MIERRVKSLPAIGLLVLAVMTVQAQEALNTAAKMIKQEQPLTIGGYGQVDFNQPLASGTFQNGELDVHRMVLMFGYKFNARTQFISEIELEHVREVYVEQAFLQYEILPWLRFRGGLMLIPMGIINEYHEPSTFNGVERPNVDKYIVPSTWREIGTGFAGTFPMASVSYQLYAVNGFNGYDGEANLSGSGAFRGGRQKGSASFMSSPNVTFKVDYFGIQGLQLGFSGYMGKSQSSLYNSIDKSDRQSIAAADSSVVGLTMLGADARFRLGGFQIRAQVNYGFISNSSGYNEFTGSDLGSAIAGWYGELAYNLLHGAEQSESELIPFIRFENYNTHASVDHGTVPNAGFHRTDLTMGLGWKMAGGAMLKMDYQAFRTRADSDSKHQFNAGVAVWF